MTEPLDICKTCGRTITAHKLACQTMLFRHVATQAECDECLYDGFARTQTLIAKCPWKQPYPRRKWDGSLPDVFIDHMRSLRVREDEPLSL